MILDQPQHDAQPQWMDLKAIQRYACVSERTIRDWIHRPQNPLPAFQVGKKILIRRSQFDQWLESHPCQSAGVVDIVRIVDEVMSDLRKAS
jgi:excisionase family DNA binding protein